MFRALTPSGEIAIKVFPNGQLQRARLEQQLLAHLTAVPDPRYRVQAVVPTRSGEPLLIGEVETCLVTRWEPGEYKPFTLITADEWAGLGRSLGALHRRLDAASDLELPARLSELVRARDPAKERATLERCRALAVERDPADALALTRYFGQRAQLLDGCAARCLGLLPEDDERPIHNDFNQYNYLFGVAGPPLILDWERAIGAPREYEVVRCLNQLPLIAPELARRFVAGYLEARPLRASALGWAVDAALTEHAVKHWPVELWLEGAPGARARLSATMEMVEALSAGRAQLDWFYQHLPGTLRA